MDKYLVPSDPFPINPKHSKRRSSQWKRSLLELNGKFDRKYQHDVAALLMQSYSEVMVLPHTYHIDGAPCQAHVNWFLRGAGTDYRQNRLGGEGISALEFDKKGIYLASVTKSGCLTVHDYESLYCNGSKEDETKQLLHISTGQQLDVVRWNVSNQYEVACTSMKSSEVCIFDIGYVSSEPVEVLRKRRTISVHGYNAHKGFSDVAFCSHDDSRSHEGAFHWDLRLTRNIQDWEMEEFHNLMELLYGLDTPNNSLHVGRVEMVYSQ
ncbi:putative feruloyl CoA ortho-hydroxylase 1-like [Capsicum annuum]|nr:putative feruloyl CoA ortho-hydroxylase 1-like [Capsicum annuum]